LRRDASAVRQPKHRLRLRLGAAGHEVVGQAADVAHAVGVQRPPRVVNRGGQCLAIGGKHQPPPFRPPPPPPPPTPPRPTPPAPIPRPRRAAVATPRWNSAGITLSANR